MLTGILNKDDNNLEAIDHKRKFLFHWVSYIVIITGWKF